MKKILIRRVVLAILASFFFVQESFAQCSMCRAIVETDISGKGTGINNGIVYLMTFPYLLIGLIVIGIVVKIRRDNQATA